MKIIGSLACSATLLGGVLAVATTPAEAAVLQCVSSNSQTAMLLEDTAACGAVTAGAGNANAYGVDGVGYANATGTAYSLAAGIAGGVGASEGASGIPTALGVGPDAVAITSVDDRSLSISVAFTGSRALVAGTDVHTECLGAAAFAWNAQSGRGCLATPFGTFGIG